MTAERGGGGVGGSAHAGQDEQCQACYMLTFDFLPLQAAMVGSMFVLGMSEGCKDSACSMVSKIVHNNT